MLQHDTPDNLATHKNRSIQARKGHDRTYRLLSHGYGREWIFQSDNPAYDYRLSYNAADRKLRKLCARLKTVSKSPHKLRKTCISTLLDNPDVNDRTVQRFAGHSDISTTYRFYNFERKSKEEQALAIDAALSL